MGQKVHPIGFRLGLTEPHKSQWFARFSKYKYSQSVLEDHMLRKTLKNTLNNLFLKPLSSVSKNNVLNRQNFEANMPEINNITIERKFIPYQIIISIHAKDCHLFKKKIHNLGINRELIAKMLKVRAFRFHLKNKINNLKVIYKKSQDPVFKNRQLDIREKRLKKRQTINFIYRQRIAKDFVIAKKENKIITKLTLQKKTKKKIYLPIKYKIIKNKRKNDRLVFLGIQKKNVLNKKMWFNKFIGQTLIPSPKRTRVLKFKMTNKNSFIKTPKYFNNSSYKKICGFSSFTINENKNKSLILNDNFKNSSKNITHLRQKKGSNNKSFLVDPMYFQSKKLFQSRLFKKKIIKMNNSFGFFGLFGSQKKPINRNNCFGLRMKKKFVRIFLNKISVKFTQHLKESYQDWYNKTVQNKNLSPFLFLKKWRFIQSPIFLTLLKTLKIINKKKQFSLKQNDFIQIFELFKKIKNYFVPLKKILNSLKKKIRLKVLTLQKEFIVFGSISKVQRFSFYQVLYYFNYLNKFVNEIKKIHKRQLSIYKFDQDNNLHDDLIHLFSPFFQNTKYSTNLGNKMSSFLKDDKQLNQAFLRLTVSHQQERGEQNRSNNNYIDLSDGNVVNKLQKSLPSKIAITRLTRRMKMVEYIKDLILKHRKKNLYFYLPIISEARQKIHKNNIFIKQKSKNLFGSDGAKINLLMKENLISKKKNAINANIKKKLTPQINKILQKTWNLRLEENKETAYLLKLKSILQEQQRLRKIIEFKSKVRINFFNIDQETMETKASVVCGEIIKNLEKRQPFRQVIKTAQKSVMKAKGNIKGIKIQVGGRLNGAEIARTEWVKAGRVPLQSVSSNIDYSYGTASTVYGIIGVKVWIFKGYQKMFGYKKLNIKSSSFQKK